MSATASSSSPFAANDRRRLIPIKEATEIIGMHDVRVTKRLISEKRLKAKVIGRNILVTRKSLNEFIAD